MFSNQMLLSDQYYEIPEEVTVYLEKMSEQNVRP